MLSSLVVQAVYEGVYGDLTRAVRKGMVFCIKKDVLRRACMYAYNAHIMSWVMSIISSHHVRPRVLTYTRVPRFTPRA